MIKRLPVKRCIFYIMKPSILLQIVIAILLLFCLADMPYGFYELVRFAAAGAFVYLSYYL